MPLGAFKAVVTSKAGVFVAPAVLNEQCLTLDGAGDAVTFGDNHDPGTVDFTWEAWARTASATSQVIANKRVSGSGINGVNWVITSGGASQPFLDDGAGQTVTIAAGSGFGDGLWHHHAFTWDTSTGTLRSYADGVLIGTVVNAAMIGANFNNATLFRVGSDPTPGNFFNGEVDEVRVWSRLRTLQEIRDNRFRHAKPSEANLIGYYRFEGDVTDETTTGADGTLIGDAAATAVNPPFRHNDAYSAMLQELAREDASPDKMAHWVLDESTGVAAFSEGLGSGDEFPGAYTNSPTLADLALLGLRGFKGALFDRDTGNQIVNGVGLTPLGTTTNATWSAVIWFRMSATAIGLAMKFFDQRQSAGTNTNASTGLDSTGHLQIVTGSDVPNGLSAGTVLEEERIYCAIYTHDAPSQRRRLYVNGVLDGSDAGARNYTGGANGMFSIGRRPGTLNDQFMKGNIMDVAVFREVELTADQAEMIFLVGSAGRYKDVVLDDAPESYWRLDDPSGTTAVDQQGANVGTYVGAPTLGAATLLPGGGGAGDERELGKSVTFDGSTHEVSLASVPIATGDVSNFSIELWFTADNITGTKNIFNNRNVSNDTNMSLLQIGATLQFDKSPVSGGTPLTSSAFIVAGVTYHVVYVEEGANQTLYVNGVVDTTAALAETFSGGAMTVSAWARNANSGASAFPGTLDETAVYSTSLSSDRVRAHYLAGVATTQYGATVGADGPVGYYKLDEASGTTAFDETGVLDGTHVGATPGVASLVQSIVDVGGVAADFDGVDDRIEFASPLIATGDVSNFSIEAIIKPRVLQLSDLVNNREVGGDTNMNLQLKADGVFRFDKSPPAAQEFDGVKALAVDERGHVVYVETGATRELFVDGQLDATDGAAETFTGSAQTKAAFGISAQALTQDFDGVMDEVALYDFSLRQPRVEAHFRVAR